MDKLYLITGAAGHLGHNLAGLLTVCGKKVRGLILPGERHALPAEVEIFEGNVCDKKSLAGFFNTEGYDYTVLIHAAAIITIQSKADENIWNVNVNGTAKERFIIGLNKELLNYGGFI